MARPKKEGLEYFPMDVSMFEDERVVMLLNKLGPQGLCIWLRLLCSTYKYGMCLKFGKFESEAFCALTGASEQQLEETVDYCLQIGLFNPSVFEATGLLTSKAIQKRFFEACKRRKEIEVPEGALLINTEDYSSLLIKVKESKVKEVTRCNTMQHNVAITPNTTETQHLLLDKNDYEALLINHYHNIKSVLDEDIEHANAHLGSQGEFKSGKHAFHYMRKWQINKKQFARGKQQQPEKVYSEERRKKMLASFEIDET